MDIRFNCGTCGHHMVIDEAGAGMVVACPECGRDTTVPKLTGLAPETIKEQTVAIKWTPPPPSHPHIEPPKK